MMRYKAAFVVLLLPAGTALAASSDAWQEFAATVQAKCLTAAKSVIEAPQAIVDPYGSERYGLAIVTGKAKGADTTISHICVMDKETQTAELGSELTADQVAVTAGH